MIRSYSKIGGALAFSLVIFTACQEDVDVRDKNGSGLITVMNSMESEGKFSRFYDAIGANGLRISDEFNGSGDSYEYTIFAPTDTAFGDFLARYDTYDGLDNIPDDLLRSLVEYHVVAGSLSAADLNGTTQTTVQEGEISVNGTTVIGANNTANVAVADRAARNGFLHELDAVLIPPTFPTQTILDIAGGSDFTSLAAAVTSFSDLVDAIDGGNGAFTVMAPTNAAFSAFLASQGFASLDAVPAPLLRTILEYHVIPGVVGSADIVGSQNTLSGEVLDLPDDTEIVATADVAATNGLVHVISEVLVPPSLSSVAGVILANPNFSTLAAALVDKDLITPLSTGARTVFAPNNAAFTAANITDPTSVSANILTYHVLGDSVPSTAIMSGFAPTLNDASVILNTGMGVTVDGVAVVTADISASNGYIHEIGAILTPPQSNIVTLASNTSELSILSAAIQRGELDGALSEGGPYTVFAPSDAAFTAVGLTADSVARMAPDQIQRLLTFHVVPGRFTTSNLPNGEIETLAGEGEENKININNRVFTITTPEEQVVDLTVNSTLDVQATDGVVHIMDAVLLP
ncbi:fasciclin domain-containing protein [Tunicatimonas pelagia]|uniref:fasciclin domain-containing protein n=1 Tax=Tunicatimonas pelagia TaxID=931531 RepID=UPI00266639AB|nr:fasciclin domain-containing protein [Tunicatimonas pelagia]WKN42654.1 fasciclin domain-containing protein [Tunicatimonas pelagia]